MVDPSERKALLDAIERFDAAYVDLVQAANRMLRILDLEAKKYGGPTVMDQPEPVKPSENAGSTGPATGARPPVLPSGEVAKKPIQQMKAMESGFLGDACRSCGMFMLVRVGTCVRCNACGWDSGCG